MPGPVPYRTEELSRERNANRGNDRPTLKRGTMRPVTIPRAGKGWHPTASRLFNALKKSGQADFFQESDWAYAFSLCEDISAMKKMQEKTGKPHAESLKALYGAMSNLMFTEADRRRLRIELMEEEDDEDSPAEAIVKDYRERLRAVN